MTHEVERALSCGDPTDGFAWLACPEGHHHRLVQFSCQTCGTFPSCCGRRMAERARRWTEELLPSDFAAQRASEGEPPPR